MTCLQKTKDFICCNNRQKFPDPYEFDFNGHSKTPQNQHNFESNFVRTSKYTVVSFFPMALLLQFKRRANVYFLIIAILQTVPQISPLNPLTAWVPLIIVLAISMLRQGYQDFQRVKSDKITNYQTLTHVRRDGKFEECNWSKVVVGDICRVQQQEMFPADLILLASSNQGGIAFIETASLDGQKNLKPRSAYTITQKFAGDQRYMDGITGRWLGSLPEKQLEKFSSQMDIDGQRINYSGYKQFLYRGTRLKNTKWIYGLVIYTGSNTKIMLSSQSVPQKMSQIQQKVNNILVFIFLVQVICSLIVAIFYGVFRKQIQASSNYILWPTDINDTGTSQLAGDSILIFFTYFVLINTMIPISLIVSIQIVKFSQSKFINSDRLMYSQYRKKFSQVKSASLNQELGQIQYVFSDKTGTLTMNLMEFKIAVIGQQMYGDLSLISEDPNVAPQQGKEFKDNTLKNLMSTNSSAPANPSITIKDRQSHKTLNLTTQKSVAQQYLKALALAHQVVVQTDKQGKTFYQGPSPDQITLVDAAKAMDIQFIKSTQATTTISIRGDSKTYELKELFPFTSDRKRMSVIVKDNGIYKMYTKGADSIIKARLAKDQTLNLDSQLNRFSSIGLRTLLVAMRIVSDEQYNQFKKAVNQLPQKDRDKPLDKLISDLQSNLYLLGATAVMDRLQDDVPETIRDLIRASSYLSYQDIKVWILTGDKMETAENIAKSCNLIQSHFQILRYQPKQGDVPVAYLRKIASEAQELTQKNQQKAFLIQGSDLASILGNQQCQVQLANLARNCQAVVCCRLAPIQKAEVVTVVRKRLNKITLAIGDGSNDVSMISAAHIGVGLFGEEGMGAVQASDYALPEFRMLWRLLFVHGRWNYIRISEMTLYFFYKNMLFTIPQLIFAFYNGYSGQTAFDDYYIALYNLVFTSLPLIVRAVLQQDVNYFYKQDEHNLELQTRSSALLIRNQTLAKQNKYLPPGYKINKYFYRLFPKIYFIGQQNCVFNNTNYFMWVLQGVIQAIIITFFTIYIIGEVSINQTGFNSDWWLVGLTIFSAVVVVVTVKLATHTKFWSVALFLIMVLSLGLYVIYMWISNYTLTNHIQGTTYIAWTTAQTYLLVLLLICGILTIDGIIVFLDFDRGGYASKMREVVRTQQQINKAYFDQVSLRISDNLSVKPQ